ncbi:MAG TPA: glycoside hydrolase family 3 C-terminal domain-containing protein [Acidimicrobiales bacterium]|nr:glycoside hydrolase family 3 C-terminal domain-containing protein [Acidimicrobiales bacterium]
MHERVDAWLTELTLEEKCRLLGGATSWRTHPIERVGIPVVKMSDGPNGVRGEFSADDRTPSVVVPVGIVQGATWDPELIGRVGDLLGKEARRKSAHVLLAPAVNLHRTPIGGRTFEYFSEDPELTAALAVEMVRGVQAHEVAVTVKHFVANDTEVERNTVDVIVDERVLRELYLRPFEATVREAGAWGVMSAYNKLDGDFCAANDRLLNEILRHEWGFDGFVVSDWYGAHEPVSSANGGLSVEMPGPARVYGPHLQAAVEEGRVDEATVDVLVRDVLLLIERTHAVERSADEPEQSVDDPAERALCREVAIAGTVLAKNVDHALPLAGAADRRPRAVAVVGPNAADTRTMGGGSSALLSLPQRTILEVLQERLGDLTYEVGCTIDKHTPLPPADRLVGPDGTPGLEVVFVNGTDPDGEPAHISRTSESALRFFGSIPPGVGPGPCVLKIRGAYVPAVDGPHDVGAIVTGRPHVRVGEAQLATGGERLPPGEAFFGMASAEQLATVDMRAGEAVDIEVELRMNNPFAGIRIGVRPPADETMMDRAVEAARSADAVVVVVGTNDEWETEGSDRTTIALPGNQDELVRRVAGVNDRTVVVVNAGSPVAMPWVDDVEAILLPFFGGMEMAEAVADVLLGVADPGGRLPTTFPKRLEDAPAWPYYAPSGGVQRYEEGFAVGYRGHDRSGVEPLFPFGHGLSYGEVEWGPATTTTATSATTAPLSGGSVAQVELPVTVTVPVTNTSDRDATVVVQGYVAPIDPPVDREPKALRTWRKAVVAAGEAANVELVFRPEHFRRWDVGSKGWVVDPGEYDLVIAASATDVRSTIRVRIGD